MSSAVPHSPVTVALWIAGLVQLTIAVANFVVPSILKYRENLARVAPIIRQVFIVHAGYIVAVIVLFAAITLGFPAELSSGRGLGRLLAAALALFWLGRIPLQLFYYDPTVRRAHRSGDVAMTAALVFLAATYAWAALR